MSKSKHTPEFLAMVAQEYIDGAGSTYQLAEKYHKGNSVEIAAQNNIHPSVLESWIKLYNANRELKDYSPKREVYMAAAKRKSYI